MPRVPRDSVSLLSLDLGLLCVCVCAGILPQIEAQEKGYSQVLWLFGENDSITEVGTMNFFMHWINPKGKEELITAPLDGTHV
jgi:branched-subunit amino acid aminotransferase/4-amino-4-deoxychorismate lyase